MAQTKTQEPIDTYKKDYVYHLDYYVSSDGRYKHPYIDFIRLGESCPEGRYGTFRSFTLEYEQNMYKDDGSIPINSFPYGGIINHVSLCDIDDIYQIMKAASSQIKKLELYSPDAYQNMVSALRAAGYRRGIMYDFYIADIE